MSEKFNLESKGFFEKFWSENISNSVKHFLGEKIWQEGWNSAFCFLAPRMANIRVICEKVVEEIKKLDPVYNLIEEDTLKSLKAIAEDKRGYEQPLIDELMRFKKISEDIKNASEMNDVDFKQLTLSLLRNETNNV